MSPFDHASNLIAYTAAQQKIVVSFVSIIVSSALSVAQVGQENDGLYSVLCSAVSIVCPCSIDQGPAVQSLLLSIGCNSLEHIDVLL